MSRPAADLGQPGADGRLAGDERRPAGGAALLAVPTGEHRAFLGDAVDVRRLVAHVATVVAARVVPADVVAHDDEDVRLFAADGLDGEHGKIAGGALAWASDRSAEPRWRAALT